MSEMQRKSEKIERFVRFTYSTIAITSFAVTAVMINFSGYSPYLELAAMCFAFCMPLSVMIAVRPKEGNCFVAMSGLIVLIAFFVGVAGIFFHVSWMAGLIFLVSSLAALIFRVQKTEAVFL